MLEQIGYMVAGLAVLTFGADWLVKGASRLALSLGIAPLVIGLTIVAFGTSAPEMAVSITSAWSGANDLAVAGTAAFVCTHTGLVPHAGRDLDEKLFASGVADVILSGHDHDLYMQFNERTAIVEPGEDGMAVVAVDLTVKVEEKDGKRRVRWWPRFRC